MSIQRRTCVLAIGSGLCVVVPWKRAWSAPPDGIRVAIAQAARLSVLSDRMMRCQAQRVLQILSARAEKVLSESTSEAERLLQQLASSPTITEDMRPVFTTAQQAYQTLLQKNRLIDLKNSAALIELADQADEVAESVDAVVALLIKRLSRPVTSVLSDTADMQRLTQDTAVHFLLARLGHKEQEQIKKVKDKRGTFEQRLAALKGSALKTTAIQNQLALLEPQWLLMSTALNRSERDVVTLEHISTTSERLLEVLITLYGLYEQALQQTTT